MSDEVGGSNLAVCVRACECTQCVSFELLFGLALTWQEARDVAGPVTVRY